MNQHPLILRNCITRAIFEADRRPRKRSLPSVNEHFEGKSDDKRALLDYFILYITISISICAISTLRNITTG